MNNGLNPIGDAWAWGLPDRKRDMVRMAPCPSCLAPPGFKCLNRAGKESHFVHINRLNRRRSDTVQ